jgi:hypothetical protein
MAKPSRAACGDSQARRLLGVAAAFPSLIMGRLVSGGSS